MSLVCSELGQSFPVTNQLRKSSLVTGVALQLGLSPAPIMLRQGLGTRFQLAAGRARGNQAGAAVAAAAPGGAGKSRRRRGGGGQRLPAGRAGAGRGWALCRWAGWANLRQKPAWACAKLPTGWLRAPKTQPALPQQLPGLKASETVQASKKLICNNHVISRALKVVLNFPTFTINHTNGALP